MLATIFVDTFQKAEAGQIAAALDEVCNNSFFSSAAIYSFWSFPEQEILYIGLAKDVTTRFKQHSSLLSCDPKGCKSCELNDYFSTKDRVGYSLIVQSALSLPLTKEDEKAIVDVIDDDGLTVDVSDIFEARENIAIAEGMLIELFEQLADRLPKWNKIRGLKRGQKRRSLYSMSERMQYAVGDVAGKSPSEIEREIASSTPYELLLNLEGSELSELNARATLREVAENATFCGHELLLYAIRTYIVSQRLSFDESLRRHLLLDEFAKERIDQMKADGYWNRKVKIPGF